MSWGNKLVIVFVVFVALMAILVYKAVNTKFELVTKDYYKEELRYQDKIDGAANARTAGSIMLKQDASTITLQLPTSLQTSISEGEAWFYCKTDAAKDQRLPIKIEDGIYSFDKSVFAKSTYELKLQLTNNSKQYYYKEFITVQ
jgi:hypothetical protein